jgi:hypothetical protein
VVSATDPHGRKSGDIKRKSMRCKFNEIDELSKQNETRKLYMAVKKLNKGYQPQRTRCRDKDAILMANPTEVETWWTEYFQEQLGKKEAMIM